MDLLDETKKAFEEFLGIAHEGLARQDAFTEESVNALLRSLRGRKEALQAVLHGTHSSSQYHSTMEGW